MAGHLPALETAAVGWQSGQHQPDCLAALTVAYDVLIHSAGPQVHIVSPLDVERRIREGKMPPPEWLRRSVGGRPSPITPIAPYLARRIGDGGYGPMRGFDAGGTRPS